MAYMSQDKKRELAPGIKRVLKKYGMTGTIAVRHRSTLVVNIKGGAIDFGENIAERGYAQVNPYWIEQHWEGVARDFLLELKDAMMSGNWDKSDIQTDYFNVGWYIDINIGQWNKPYVCSKANAVA